MTAGRAPLRHQVSRLPLEHGLFAVLVPYRFRAAHRRWAGRHGLFWLPCPLCGKSFGGHEWRRVGGLPDSVPDPLHQPEPGSGSRVCVAICPRCTAAGRGVE